MSRNVLHSIKTSANHMYSTYIGLIIKVRKKHIKNLIEHPLMLFPLGF